jgi:predicted Zn-dependent protease
VAPFKIKKSAQNDQGAVMNRSSIFASAVTLAIAMVATGCAGDGSDAKGPKKRTILATEFDDIDIGGQSAQDLAAQMGLYRDPAVNAYVSEVGRRMVQFAARRPFYYSFNVIDQAMPNAFALPGGHVYVSRGLLALANNENELAGVIGHEITHSAERHAATQQEMARRGNPFQMPIMRMGKLAAYGRAQEHDADRGGQQIAASAGYDPAGLPDFLQRLGNLERLRGGSRMPSYLSTHPGTGERVATTSQRAAQLERGPSQPVEADALGYLKRIDGIVVGPDPAEGVFRGNRFVHPALGFELRFPEDWKTANERQTVGARSPDGGAIVFLSVEGEAQDPKEFADKFMAPLSKRFKLTILRNNPIKIRGIEGWRVAAKANVSGRQLAGQLTFIPYNGLMYRITAVAPVRGAAGYIAQARNTVRSFRPTPTNSTEEFEVMRLRITRARSGESVAELMKRTSSALQPKGIGVINGVFFDHRFKGGELVKYVALEKYIPKS